MEKKTISIKEIARLSGVSVATVSRVINNNGRFSKKTKEKVLKIIEETGYETNSIAKSLRMSRSYSIGILVPDISNYFFAAIVQKIEELLFEKGYSTIICNTARNEEKEKAYLKMLEGKMIDGLIVISGAESFDFDLKQLSVPIVCIDREPKNHDSTVFIASNHYQGAISATETLIQKGCQHLAIVTHKRSSPSSRERIRGFKDTLKKQQLTYNKQTNFLAIDALNVGYDATAITSFFEKQPHIDGVFAVNDFIALELLQLLPKLGKKIPQEIKLIGFDAIPTGNFTSPTLSSVQQNIEQIATQAVDSLLLCIKGDTQQLGLSHIVPVSLALKGST